MQGITKRGIQLSGDQATEIRTTASRPAAALGRWRQVLLAGSASLALLFIAVPVACADTELGGVNLDQHCQAHGFDHAVLVGSRFATNAAYNWRCETGASQSSIDVTAACQGQYANASATARALDLNDAYSWRCFAPDGSAGGSAGYEPNDSIAAAYGPLSGGVTYAAGLETQNDEDWFTFYTNGQQQFDISFTNLTNGCTNFIMSFVDTNGEELHYVRPNFNETRHIQYTSPTSARYYLRVYDLIGQTCSYQLRIDPAGALTAQPPTSSAPGSGSTNYPAHSSGPSSACRHARNRVATLSRQRAEPIPPDNGDGSGPRCGKPAVRPETSAEASREW